MTQKQSLTACFGCAVLVLLSGAAGAQTLPQGEGAMSPEPRPGRTPDACSVLVAAGVMQLLGAKAEQRRLPGQTGAAGPLCLYEQPSASVSLGLVTAVDPKTVVDERDRLRRAGRKVQDEPELGSGAFSSTLGPTTTLVAFKGDLLVNLQFANVGAAALRPFAKRVLGDV